MKWYSVESTVAKSVDIEMIRHEFSLGGERLDTDSVDNTNTEIITRNNGRGVIIDEWEKLDTIASNLFSKDADIIDLNYKKEWDILFKNQNHFCIRQGLLFQKYKLNTENAVRQASIANASKGEDHNFFQTVNSNFNHEKVIWRLKFAVIAINLANYFSNTKSIISSYFLNKRKLKKPVKYKTVDKRRKYNRMVIPRVHSNNNNIIRPSKELTEIRYSHKLRWYNITLQEKGFHHINDVLDTYNINGYNKNKNNLDTHNEYLSPIITKTDITVKCDILAY
ncbi:hypothetical protein H8356DRAFT_1422798 [Neocallimastix lanati (nom. inval.)]|nr:hypothetical protein H8356DRAFT_1422798 [Neocallimastix sp. JGI-2020a]